MDEVFSNGNKERIWQKYCSFLTLDTKEFLEIQKHLLREQMDLIQGSPLYRKFMSFKPRSTEEFRDMVPLTQYADYCPALEQKDESALAVKPDCWARTSGLGGAIKWVPFTSEFLDLAAEMVISSAILASARMEGDVKIENNMKVLHNLPPVPYGASYFARNINKFIDVTFLPELTRSDKDTFEARTQAGFKEALVKGVDVVSSLSSVLLKMGEQFEENHHKLKIPANYFLNPGLAYRLMKAKLQSEKEKRPVLPKDLWPIRAIIAYGMDTSIYRKKLVYYWGKEPLELYAATETGIMATQSWNKQGMTFIPESAFYEFIPENERLKNKKDKNYVPKTVLIDQVQPGHIYEIVITSFHGMPFLRYRIGDLVKFVSIGDAATGVKLPQMIFESRADGIIDLASFARLDEKTIWQAIANTGVEYVDWMACKEYEKNKPVLRIYIELKQAMDPEDLKRLIHDHICNLSSDYCDLETMLQFKPLDIKLVAQGSFRHYFQKQQSEGADLAHLKPPHINPSARVIRELIGAA